MEKFDTKVTEKLFDVLTEYVGIPRRRDAESYIKTAHGALEYAAVIARHSGITKVDYLAWVESHWDAINLTNSYDDLKKELLEQ